VQEANVRVQEAIALLKSIKWINLICLKKKSENVDYYFASPLYYQAWLI